MYFAGVPLYFLPIHIFKPIYTLACTSTKKFSFSFAVAVVSFGGIPVPYIYFVVPFLVPWLLPFKSVLVPITKFSTPAWFPTGDQDPFLTVRWPMSYGSFSCSSINQKSCVLHLFALSSLLFICFFSALTTADRARWHYHLCSRDLLRCHHKFLCTIMLPLMYQRL